MRRADVIVELLGKPIGFRAEDLLFHEREGFALLLRLNDGQRRLAVGVALVVAVHVDAADLAGHESHHSVVFVHDDRQRLADAVVSFARLDHAVDQSGENLIDQFQPPAGELDRVFAEIEAIHARIGLERADVFVGGISQRRLVAARGDLSSSAASPSRAAGQRLVAVLDRPVVIGADASHEVIALLSTLRRDIDRDVVHHRSGQADGAVLLRVVDFVHRQQRAGLEFVPQAEGVPEFVSGDRLHPVDQQLLDLLLAAGLAGGSAIAPKANCCPSTSLSVSRPKNLTRQRRGLRRRPASPL